MQLRRGSVQRNRGVSASPQGGRCNAIEGSVQLLRGVGADQPRGQCISSRRSVQRNRGVSAAPQEGRCSATEGSVHLLKGVGADQPRGQCISSTERTQCHLSVRHARARDEGLHSAVRSELSPQSSRKGVKMTYKVLLQSEVHVQSFGRVFQVLIKFYDQSFILQQSFQC